MCRPAACGFLLAARTLRRHAWALGILIAAGTLAAVAFGQNAATDAPKVRRILYNLDGDSCMWTKKDGKQPLPVTAADPTRTPCSHAVRVPRRDRPLTQIRRASA